MDTAKPLQDVDSLAAVLPSDSAREAASTLRGFDWQRWLTVELWLQIGAADSVWIEWAEDVTVVDHDGITTIQAKDLQAKVSLGLKSVRDLLDIALLRAPEVRTVLWTSAMAAVEKGSGFEEPGILLWDRVAVGAAAPDQLRTYLLKPGRLSSKARDILRALDDVGFRAAIARISWITGESAIGGLQERVERAAADRAVQLTTNPAQGIRGAAFGALLFTEVARIAIRPNRAERRLTRQDLDRLMLAEAAGAFLASATIVQGRLAAATARYQGLAARFARLRARTGFNQPEEDLVRGWTDLADDLLAGVYDAEPEVVLADALARTAWSLSGSEHGELPNRLLAKAERLAPSPILPLAKIAVRSEQDLSMAVRDARAHVGPDALGLQLLLLARTKDGKAVTDWAIKHRAADFNAAGAFSVLSQLAVDERWAEALAFCADLTREQKATRPFLHALHGFALMSDVVRPHQLPRVSAAPVPFEPSELVEVFDRASPTLIPRLTAAESEFREAAFAAQNLDFPEQARIFTELADWLQLENPMRSEAAREKVRRDLASGDPPSATLAFAKAYGIDFDHAAARIRLEGRFALGGLEPADVRALNAVYETPAERLSFVEPHREQLAALMGPGNLEGFTADLMIRAGRLDEAEALLNQAAIGALDEGNRERLMAALQGARGETTSPQYKEIWERTGDTDDLFNLCVALGRERRFPALAEAAQTLAERTREERHLLWMCDGYVRGGNSDKLLGALNAFPSEVAVSIALREVRVNLLIAAGDFANARAELDALVAIPERDDLSDDQRLLELAIESGDWEALNPLIDRLWTRRDARSARQLTEAAVIAMVRGAESRALELGRAAAERSDQDAAGFLTLWLVASALGHEMDWPEARDWFERAVSLSGPDGPLKAATLQEVAEGLPMEGERRSELTGRLARAEAPLFVVAEALGITLLDFVMGAAIRNQQEGDVRRRSMIPVFRGGRPTMDLADATVLAIDLSSLMVLHGLGRLEATLQRFRLLIPAGTLKALFTDVQRFHLHAQREAAASAEILELVGEQLLTPTPLTKCRDAALVELVGAELADLLQYAKTNDTRLCRPAPIHKPGSLLMEPVEMSGHMAQLMSTPTLALGLESSGLVERGRLATALEQLRRLDAGWAGETSAAEGKAVILDELALRYFQISGLLRPLLESRGPLLIPSELVGEAREKVAQGRMAVELLRKADGMRRVLRDGIASHRIQVCPAQDDGEFETRRPTAGLMKIKGADAFVIDDRYLNGHAGIDVDGVVRPVAVSLDVLEALGRANILSADQLRADAMAVMKAGYMLAPLTLPRLLAELQSAVRDKGIVETAELRAIREYVLRVQMLSRALHPTEALFLDHVCGAITEALRHWFATAPSIGTAKAGASWLWDLMPDPRNFLHAWQEDIQLEVAEQIFVARTAAVLQPQLIDPERMAAFRDWSQTAIVEPLISSEPQILKSIGEQMAAVFAELDQKLGASGA